MRNFFFVREKNTIFVLIFIGIESCLLTQKHQTHDDNV